MDAVDRKLGNGWMRRNWIEKVSGNGWHTLTCKACIQQRQWGEGSKEFLFWDGDIIYHIESRKHQNAVRWYQPDEPANMPPLSPDAPSGWPPAPPPPPPPPRSKTPEPQAASTAAPSSATLGTTVWFEEASPSNATSSGSTASSIYAAAPGPEGTCFSPDQLIRLCDVDGQQRFVRVAEVEEDDIVSGIHKLVQVRKKNVFSGTHQLITLSVGGSTPTSTVTDTHLVVVSLGRTFQHVQAKCLRPGDEVVVGWYESSTAGVSSSSLRDMLQPKTLVSCEQHSYTGDVIQLEFSPHTPVLVVDPPASAILTKGVRTKRGSTWHRNSADYPDTNSEVSIDWA